MTDRVIDQEGPAQTEDEKGTEAHPFGKGAGDQRRGDDGKHALIDHEDIVGNGGRVMGARLGRDPAQGKKGEIADQAAHVRAKGHAVADIDPFDADDRHHDERLQDGAKNIFATHHPCIKNSKSGRHQQHQCCGNKNKSGVGG